MFEAAACILVAEASLLGPTSGGARSCVGGAHLFKGCGSELSVPDAHCSAQALVSCPRSEHDRGLNFLASALRVRSRYFIADPGSPWALACSDNSALATWVIRSDCWTLGLPNS